MAKKRKSTAATTAAAEETQVEGSDASPASTSKQAFEAGQAKDAEVESIDWDATDTVKVNRHSLNELRMAAEDFLKEYFSRPGAYKQSHRHEDIHLALGWAASIIMGATALYAWYIPFVESRPIVIVGTALTFILNGLLWLYLTFVKKDTVFSGKRKTFSGRIETEDLLVRAKTLPKPTENPPILLVLKYSRSVNSGKTVINGPTERVQSVSFGEIFDSEGTLHKSAFARILGELENDVMALSLTSQSSEREKGQ